MKHARRGQRRRGGEPGIKVCEMTQNGAEARAVLPLTKYVLSKQLN